MIGMAELHLANFTEAAIWLGRAVEVDTGTPTALQRAYLVSALALGGRMQEAGAALAELRESLPGASVAAVRRMAYSTEPGFLAQRERLYDGLRMAGLPE
jgi:adenylate cyclase